MNYNNFGQGIFPGYGQAQMYNAPQKTPRFTNPLTEEDKKSLRNDAKFSLYVSDKDMKRAICTHKDGNQISLKENADGTVTCWICGETFRMVDAGENEVKAVTTDFVDVLNSIKTYYLDIPEGVVREFFQMIPFIEKTPEMYDLALKNFKSYEMVTPTMYNPSQQLFNFYDQVSAPGYYMPPYGGFQQPQQGYGFAPQQPAFQQPVYGAPQGYAAPMPQNVQPVGGFGYVDNGMAPGMVQAQSAPQQPAAPVTPMPQPGTPAAQAPTDVVNQTKTFAI